LSFNDVALVNNVDFHLTLARNTAQLEFNGQGFLVDRLQESRP
jgi:hypothetical protein